MIVTVIVIAFLVIVIVIAFLVRPVLVTVIAFLELRPVFFALLTVCRVTVSRVDSPFDSHSHAVRTSVSDR